MYRFGTHSYVVEYVNIWNKLRKDKKERAAIWRPVRTSLSFQRKSFTRRSIAPVNRGVGGRSSVFRTAILGKVERSRYIRIDLVGGDGDGKSTGALKHLAEFACTFHLHVSCHHRAAAVMAVARNTMQGCEARSASPQVLDNERYTSDPNPPRSHPVSGTRPRPRCAGNRSGRAKAVRGPAPTGSYARARGDGSGG